MVKRNIFTTTWWLHSDLGGWGASPQGVSGQSHWADEPVPVEWGDAQKPKTKETTQLQITQEHHDHEILRSNRWQMTESLFAVNCQGCNLSLAFVIGIVSLRLRIGRLGRTFHRGLAKMREDVFEGGRVEILMGFCMVLWRWCLLIFLDEEGFSWFFLVVSSQTASEDPRKSLVPARSSERRVRASGGQPIEGEQILSGNCWLSCCMQVSLLSQVLLPVPKASSRTWEVNSLRTTVATASPQATWPCGQSQVLWVLLKQGFLTRLFVNFQLGVSRGLGFSFDMFRFWVDSFCFVLPLLMLAMPGFSPRTPYSICRYNDQSAEQEVQHAGLVLLVKDGNKQPTNKPKATQTIPTNPN